MLKIHVISISVLQNVPTRIGWKISNTQSEKEGEKKRIDYEKLIVKSYNAENDCIIFLCTAIFIHERRRYGDALLSKIYRVRYVLINSKKYIAPAIVTPRVFRTYFNY